MGIKRTATGRIYFDADDDRLDDVRPGDDRPGGGDRQNQVLGLLGQLGDRLQRSESDREELLREVQEYRRTVADLEEKAAKAEKIVAAMQGRVSKFEKLETEIAKRQEKLETDLPERQEKLREKIEAEILAQHKKIQEKLETEITKRQEILEKASHEQNQKIARTTQLHSDLERRLKGAETIAGALEGRITESVDQQVRLNRRLEKISQDKVRLLRKIERMEEIVAETQEALRARAMVLLTDQGLAATSGGRLSLPSPDSASNDSDSFFDRDNAILPWWRKSVHLRGAALAGIVGVALVSGWLASTALFPSPDTSAQRVALKSDSASQPFETAQGYAEDPDLPDNQSGLAVRNIDSDGPPMAAATPDSPTPDKSIGQIDEKDLLAEYLDDPDALAEKLNAIEPGTVSGDKGGPDVKSVPAPPASEKPPVPSNARNAGAEAPEAVQVASVAPTHSEIETSPVPDSTGKPAIDAKPDPALPAKFAAIEKKALAGQAEAQHDLAALYTAGHDGVAQDYAKAAFWFRKAADSGVANAAYNLGVLYHQGLGLKKDMKEAIRWYKTAAGKGHPEAQYNLGIAFIEGIGVPYDPQAAAKYFESAASAGVVEAAYNLGMIYENGLLGEAHPDLALVWYKTAADKGNPEARLALEQLAKTLGISPADIDRATAHNAAAGKKASAPESLRPDERADIGAPSRRTSGVLPGMDLPVDDVLAHPDTGGGIDAASIDQVVISQIQRQLQVLGLYGGAPDGVMGEKTGKAIRSYQSAQGLPVDGRPSENLLVHMLAHDPGETSPSEVATGVP